jgi:hypothetical protein
MHRNSGEPVSIDSRQQRSQTLAPQARQTA